MAIIRAHFVGLAPSEIVSQKLNFNKGILGATGKFVNIQIRTRKLDASNKKDTGGGRWFRHG